MLFIFFYKCARRDACNLLPASRDSVCACPSWIPPAVAPSWCNCPQFRSATPAESKQREPKLLVKISRPPPAMIMVPNSVTCSRVMHHEHCPFFPFFFYSFPVSAFLIPIHPNGSVSVNALHRFPTERSHAFGVCCCRGLARMLLGLGTYYDARLSRHEKSVNDARILHLITHTGPIAHEGDHLDQVVGLWL